MRKDVFQEAPPRLASDFQGSLQSPHTTLHKILLYKSSKAAASKTQFVFRGFQYHKLFIIIITLLLYIHNYRGSLIASLLPSRRHRTRSECDWNLFGVFLLFLLNTKCGGTFVNIQVCSNQQPTDNESSQGMRRLARLMD